MVTVETRYSASLLCPPKAGAGVWTFTPPLGLSQRSRRLFTRKEKIKKSPASTGLVPVEPRLPTAFRTRAINFRNDNEVLVNRSLSLVRNLGSTGTRPVEANLF